MAVLLIAKFCFTVGEKVHNTMSDALSRQMEGTNTVMASKAARTGILSLTLGGRMAHDPEIITSHTE